MDRLDLEFLYGLQIKAKAGAEGMLSVIRFCMSIGLISTEYECPVCRKSMKLTERGQVSDSFEWVCRTKKDPGHYVRRSVRNGTWFGASRLSICEILLMTEFFVWKRSQNDIRYELRMGADTVCEWRSYFREFCVAILSSECDMIGGEGMVVEIVDIKFGKRKYNKCTYKGNLWVFGGEEKGTNRCFLRVVESRDKMCLYNVIKSTILPGTTLVSECWESFEISNDKRFQDLSADLSLSFQTPETSARGEVIDGIWNSVKKSMPRRVVTDQLDAYLGEYLWRRHHSGDDDLMATFLMGIRRVYPPKIRDSPKSSGQVDETDEMDQVDND